MSQPMFPYLDARRQVVAIGGGHGLGRVLSALSFLSTRLVGIVATTDNGGSTGRIRDQHGGIAWGDLRNCLTQITTKESVAAALFEYRFGGLGELSGHNLGNLILRALEDMAIRPTDAIDLVRHLLRVKVRLVPMSDTPVHLTGVLADGKNIFGEVSIDALDELPQSLALHPMVTATPESLTAIREADLILLGPGSFLTSIMPCLLLPELATAIQESQATVVLIDNIGKEHGIAGQLSLAERVHWLERHIGQQRLNAVITTAMAQPPLAPHVQLYQQDLHSEEVSYRHDRQKLCLSLDRLLQSASSSV